MADSVLILTVILQCFCLCPKPLWFFEALWFWFGWWLAGFCAFAVQLRQRIAVQSRWHKRLQTRTHSKPYASLEESIGHIGHMYLSSAHRFKIRERNQAIWLTRIRLSLFRPIELWQDTILKQMIFGTTKNAMERYVPSRNGCPSRTWTEDTLINSQVL